jgi:alkaline phosphatase D
MTEKFSRRQTLAVLAASAVLPMAGCAGGTTTSTATLFEHGVASGDPDHQSIVLWTRLSGTQAAYTGRWQVALDPDFTDLLQEGSFSTSSDRDMTVKVVAEGLRSGESYYYRFLVAQQSSPVGRTKTLPTGSLASLSLAVVSCSNYPFGFFNAYDAIARDEVDFVLHLGDYIYEYGRDGYGGGSGAFLGREHQPAHEIVSLADYRQRHAQYKADTYSRNLHARHPLIAVWDDHESANNPWQHGAENHQAGEGSWQQRRADSLQAYYEWMPVREPAAGTGREQYWRHYQFGDLASLVNLETRHTGRAQQVDYNEHLDAIDGEDSAQRFTRDVLGEPGRGMLSQDMERFASRELRESVEAGRPWRLIGNAIPLARTHVPPIDLDKFRQMLGKQSSALDENSAWFAQRGDYNLPLTLDAWDGYPWARQRFYQLCREAGASDLLVLTGDTHNFWQSALYDDEGRPMGLELGATGVTSPSGFAGLGEQGSELLEQMMVAHNREILWANFRSKGYVRLTLERDSALAEFIAVDRISSPQYSTSVVKQVAIERAGSGLSYS